MASFASSATTGGAHKHAWTKVMKIRYPFSLYKSGSQSIKGKWVSDFRYLLSHILKTNFMTD